MAGAMIHGWDLMSMVTAVLRASDRCPGSDLCQTKEFEFRRDQEDIPRSKKSLFHRRVRFSLSGGTARQIVQKLLLSE